MALTECYRKLAPWLFEPISQTHRLYLETHLELLSAESTQLLKHLIAEYHDQPNELQPLRLRQLLLQDAYARGGTVQAVREAYVNLFGGLLLDLPPWLTEIVHDLEMTAYPDHSERLLTVCKYRLDDAITYAQQHDSIAPETIAELHYQLGQLFLNTTRPCSAALLERVIDAYQAALQVYTSTHYPWQYAKIQCALGNAYLHFPHEQLVANVQRAFACYSTALQSYPVMPNPSSIPSCS